jgi:FlaA1/EpsC-like NDP-sugar epimerase
MGEPVRIIDLARDLIRLRGLEPGVDIALRTTGIRPGEKLHEELASASEDLRRSTHPAVLIARSALPDATGLTTTLAGLSERLSDRDERRLRTLLFEAVGGGAAGGGAQGSGPQDATAQAVADGGPLRLVAG